MINISIQEVPAVAHAIMELSKKIKAYKRAELYSTVYDNFISISGSAINFRNSQRIIIYLNPSPVSLYSPSIIRYHNKSVVFSHKAKSHKIQNEDHLLTEEGFFQEMLIQNDDELLCARLLFWLLRTNNVEPCVCYIDVIRTLIKEVNKDA